VLRRPVARRHSRPSSQRAKRQRGGTASIASRARAIGQQMSQASNVSKQSAG